MTSPVTPHETGLIHANGTASYRPRVSRETRRVLATAFLAVLVLLVLARLRFPDRPPAVNPVPVILDQLTDRASFAQLASRVAEIRDDLAASLLQQAGLRIRDDLAVTIAPRPAGDGGDRPGLIAEDRGSGLILTQTAADTRAELPLLWSPRELSQPRYLLATSPAPGGISLRPVFVGSLTPLAVPQWSEAVWALPADIALAAGTLLFTEQRELVGIVAPHERGFAVVPARTLLAAAERLLEQPQKLAVDTGLEVDELTPQIAMAAGTASGVVVTWVDPTSVAAANLSPGDVIEAVDDVEITTAEEWRVRAARFGLGDTPRLRVTRRGVREQVPLTFVTPSEGTEARLGLAMRGVPSVGTEVLRVDRGSAAAAAGLEVGDLITTIDAATEPSPAQVRSAYASMERGELMIVAIRRGGTHRVVAVQR